jgi:hypothetical protein
MRRGVNRRPKLTGGQNCTPNNTKVRIPLLPADNHDVEDDDQLARAGHQRNVLLSLPKGGREAPFELVVLR